MEAGGTDCEEETLQTAFKKLRVDAESVSGALSASDTLTPRVASRACLDNSGAKPKLGCPKDNWHGCMRKTSRGASRSQRRRRSKSPILHPPKFTYCSATASSALSPPTVGLRRQHLALPEPVDPRPASDGGAAAAQNELLSPGHISPVVFGSAAGYETHIRAAVSSPSPEEASAAAVSPKEDGGGKESSPEESAGDGAESRAAQRPADTVDFRALSKLHSSSAEGAHVPCTCAPRKCSASPKSRDVSAPSSECQCRAHHQGWNGVEVYSFTGLRNVISECERSLPSHEDAHRTLTNAAGAAAASPALSSGSPRSCSEQARAFVDDITIEDLSGYMEYYLYIPKKMSHMAEMMYT